VHRDFKLPAIRTITSFTWIIEFEFVVEEEVEIVVVESSVE
jgi:hypothetical protein